MVFYDVEVQNWFDEVGVAGRPTDGWKGADTSSFADLKVAFVGAYDDEKDKYFSIWEEDMPKLAELFQSTDTIVGYNSWGFDNSVVAPYFDFEIKEIPHIDLMVAMHHTVGFRPKLDHLAKANFGEGKIGRGEDAVKLWQEGKKDELEKYCLEDVRLTYEVWRMGEENGKLKYYDKKGFLKETEIDWTAGLMQNLQDADDEEEAGQVSLL